MSSNFTRALVSLMVCLLMPYLVCAEEQEPAAIPRPIGYWPLDGDANDTVGRQHGTLHNATLVDDAQIGTHSARFGSRAVNRSIMLGDFDPSQGDLTISLWIKPDPAGNGHQILMAKRQAWSKESLRWQFVWQDIHPKKKPIPGEPYALTKEVIRFESWSDPDSRAEFACSIKPKVWTHLVLTHTSEDGRTRLFVNGNEVDGKPQRMKFGPAKDAPVVIGGTHPKDWREICNGQIDDVQLWDEVLTPKQVASLYQQVNGDWPQWLGPHRDATWRETNVIKAFPEDGPELLWTTKIGNGFSGPAVAKGRVFIMDRVSAGKVAPKDMGAYTRKSIAGKERIVCLQESTGKQLWQYEYDCPYTIATNYANGPRATPTISGSRVYALGAEGHLSCLNVEDGSVIWSHDFKSEYGLKVPVWGIASHPLIDGDKLICVAGGTSGVAVAFNKKTGKELWRSLPAKEPGYAPPVIYEIEGERQLLIWHSDAICAVDPETGKPFWSVKINPFGGMAIAMPRLVGRDLFLMGHRRQSWMLRIAPDRRSAEIVWQGNTKIGIGGVHNTPFIENGLIFGCDLDGRFTCAKLSDGEQLWTTFEPHQAKRPVSWGNVFTLKHEDRFFLATDTGDLIIARLDADGYHETSRAHLIEPNQAIGNRKLVWSHPAFANGNIYLRNDGEIRCFSLRETRE